MSLFQLAFDQSLGPLGLRMPARMTVLPLAAGKIALVSPIPIDDALAAEIAEHGEVTHLVAPNALHHLYLAAAAARYPAARVLGPASLRKKGVALQEELDAGLARSPELAAAVDVVHIDGAPGVDEHVFFHRATKTLVVTELAFNITEPQGAFTKLVLSATGTNGKLAQSRAWRLFTKDRAAVAASLQRVLALPFESLVVAHGVPVESDARSRLAEALGVREPSVTSPAPPGHPYTDATAR